MKILILIPLWKRPEIWRIVCRNLLAFRKSVNWDIQILTVISPEDPDMKQLKRDCRVTGVDICYYSNHPVGRKMNAGVNYALHHYEFDYLMNFGSDDLIHPAIEKLYQPYFNCGCKFFGIDSLYFHNYYSKETFCFKLYTDGLACGAGRMIHRTILERMYALDVPLYDNCQERSCDSKSSDRIRQYARITDTIVPSGEFPYIVDIKTNTNINHISFIELHQTQITKTESNFLELHYGKFQQRAVHSDTEDRKEVCY